MPDAQDIPGARQPAAGPGRRRVRRRRSRPLLLRYWGVLPIVALVAAAPLIWNWILTPHTRHVPLPGYITDIGKIQEEYLLFTGKPLAGAEITEQFVQANNLMLAGNYSNAAILLEEASKQVAVPAVFNNLGVLYMKLKDGPHAIRAFRDALARNHDYQPVRANLKNMNIGEAADPGNSELEPNDTNSQANVVWLDKPVEAIISPSIGDIDCFWFTTPRPPRDHISVEIINRSITLVPRMRIYDASGKMVSGLREATGPGGSLRFDFSPPANAFYYVQVEGASSTSGPYSLSVSSLHAYDVYEPNDDILNPTRLALGQTISANIMDANDTDFFSFVSPVAAPVTIDIASLNATLIPGLSTFAPDLRNIGFGPEVKDPGGSLHHVMQVEANQTYYLQVWAKGETAGPYSLTIK
jgi:hypothetical protein